MTEKVDLRRHLREQLRSLSPAEKAVASAHLCRLLRQEPAWQACRRVFGFVPLPSEPDYLAALRPSQRLLVPKTRPDGLLFYRLFEALPETGESSEPRAWPHPDRSPSTAGTPTGASPCSEAPPCWEPPEVGTPVWPQAGDLVLVPGLGFTIGGERLGRGGGYYDRFLARVQTQTATPATTWGVAFSCQIVSDLPTEPHDRRVTKVLVGGQSG